MALDEELFMGVWIKNLVYGGTTYHDRKAKEGISLQGAE